MVDRMPARLNVREEKVNKVKRYSCVRRDERSAGDPLETHCEVDRARGRSLCAGFSSYSVRIVRGRHQNSENGLPWSRGADSSLEGEKKKGKIARPLRCACVLLTIPGCVPGGNM